MNDPTQDRKNKCKRCKWVAGERFTRTSRWGGTGFQLKLMERITCSVCGTRSARPATPRLEAVS